MDLSSSVMFRVKSSFEKEKDQPQMTDDSDPVDANVVMSPLSSSHRLLTTTATGSISNNNNNNNHINVAPGGGQFYSNIDPNAIMSDSSLTDFLFDDDINLNEPLPLISSSGGPDDYSNATLQYQDSWRQPEANFSANLATATMPTTAQQQQQQQSATEFPGTAHASSSSAVTTTIPGSHLAAVEPTGPPVPGPFKNDVLLGRGGRNNQWSGNELLRSMAKLMADRYAQAHKRDKPGLAWILVTQMRQLDPPTRFLKQIPTSGEWFEASDEVAKEKASQCLRDIVAAAKTGVSTGVSRKRAFASAPELIPSKRHCAADVGPVSERQNATFNMSQLGGAGRTTAAAPNPFLGQNNPLLAVMGSRAPGSNSLARVVRTLPPKAISCVSLGASHRTTSSLAPSSGHRSTHQDPLLRQLQLLRAQQQQQQQNSMFNSSSSDAQFPLQMFQQQLQPAVISQTSMMMQPIRNHDFGSANATWDTFPQQPSSRPLTEPMPYPSTSCSTSGITTARPNSTTGGGIDLTDEDAALKRWIDRLAEEDF